MAKWSLKSRRFLTRNWTVDARTDFTISLPGWSMRTRTKLHHGSDRRSLVMLLTLSRNSTDATHIIQNRAIDTRLIPPVHRKQSLGQPFSMYDITLSQESDGHL